ncbi:multidrug efflux SMR transporter [Schumannella luteola]|uniref:Small multidrug resistance pump n=1 Tax=Schumannella luteola TaxID=472059 RepID=A0A852YHI0_9MICO|nr:SMR family transporter [Schumannella luteola]NYH00775.1 small multidrug resistance pump [Schumannella luteola]TPW91577.1 multidrug efflux SMR transporter [Schumannella luteola]
MTRWLLLAGAIVCEVSATLALDAAQRNPGWFVLVAAGYLGAFLLLPQVLRRGVPLGVAYGLWGASGVALTAVLSAVLFGDPLTPTMLGGIALIIAGVLVVEIGSQRAERQRAQRERASGAAATSPDEIAGAES